jgi:hypothetical protein
MANISAIRKKYEQQIYDLMDEFDVTGFNSQTYKDSFSKMSDKQFIDLMKRMISQDDFNLSLDVNQTEKDPKKSITLEKIQAIAKKEGVKLTQYVFMPFRNPNGRPMCTLTRVPIIYCPVRRFFQQMLIHKNSLSNNNENINPVTGQVVNDDKTASTTNVQTFALSVTNQNNAIKEFLGPRSDDPVSKQQMLTSIEQTGEVNIKDLDIETHNKQSINTTEVYCKAAGIDLRFSGHDTEIDLDED